MLTALALRPLVLVRSYTADTVTWHENRGGAPLQWVNRVVSYGVDFVITAYAEDLDGVCARTPFRRVVTHVHAVRWHACARLLWCS
jgi:hypothetical protein